MRWALSVTVSLVLVAVSGCVGQSFETIPSAGWKPGYTFGYTISVETDLESVFLKDGELEERDSVHEAEGPVIMLSYRVLSTTMKMGATPLYLVGVNSGNVHAEGSTSGSASISVQPEARGGLLAVQQSDLQPQRTVVEYERACATCPPSSPQISFSADKDNYSWIRFPLTHEDTWAGSIPMTDFLFGEGALKVESTVGGMVQAPGPYGEVDAVRIRHTMTNPALETLEAELRAEARNEGVEVKAFDLSMQQDAEVLYAPSLHNILLDQRTIQTRFHLEFEQDGHSFEGDLEAKVVLTTALVAAELTEGPEMSLLEAIASLDDPPELPVLPPVGGEPMPPPVSALRLTVDKGIVNAADQPTVTFTTAVSGTGVVDRFEVADAMGQIVAQGDGGAFTLKVTEPGTYFARVAGHDAEGRPLTGKATFVADYRAELPAECPLVAAWGVIVCPEASVPVRPDLQAVRLVAARQPVLDEPGVGSLYLYGPSGQWVSAPMAGSEAVLEVDVHALEVGDWRLQYEPFAGVAEDVTYTIELLHSGASSGLEAETAAPTGFYAKAAQTLRDRTLGSARDAMGFASLP